MNNCCITIFFSLFCLFYLNTGLNADKPKKNENIQNQSLEEKLLLLKNKEIQQNQQKKQNLSEIIKLGNQIEFAKDKEKLLNNELFKIDSKIIELNTIISDITSKITELNQKIENSVNQIEINESELKNCKIKFSKRLRSTFKEHKKYSSLSNLMTLLESKKIIEFSLKFKMLNMISQNDRLQIEKILYLIAKLKTDKETLETNKTEKNKLLADYEIIKNKLVSTKNEKEKFIEKLAKNREYLTLEIENRQRQMKVIEATINNLVIEQKQTKELIELSKLGFKNKKGKLPWPLKRTKLNKILSKFSGTNSKYRFEIKTDGIEIKCFDNQEIFSVAEGIVIFADWIDSFGWTVIISHGSDYITLYAHLNEILVKHEQKIGVQQIIGKAGDTGSLFGTSLFFQIREGKKTVNPEFWLIK
ncbi:peptidoglycan DD-metalloendopeptidase family protein [Candidatus Dependentiae bacterium]|nr:peptidoglycan DD-metalloendopeptidase family protein [Candidatus Dependentiae bacterium]